MYTQRYGSVYYKCMVSCVLITWSDILDLLDIYISVIIYQTHTSDQCHPVSIRQLKYKNKPAGSRYAKVQQNIFCLLHHIYCVNLVLCFSFWVKGCKNTAKLDNEWNCFVQDLIKWTIEDKEWYLIHKQGKKDWHECYNYRSFAYLCADELPHAESTSIYLLTCFSLSFLSGCGCHLKKYKDKDICLNNLPYWC